MTIDQRIARLEKVSGFVEGKVPGTNLVRVITPTAIEWTLALGLMEEVKHCFTAPTIEECLNTAEKKLL